jgi:hypothetical protein
MPVRATITPKCHTGGAVTGATSARSTGAPGTAMARPVIAPSSATVASPRSKRQQERDETDDQRSVPWRTPPTAPLRCAARALGGVSLGRSRDRHAQRGERGGAEHEPRDERHRTR